MHSSTCGPHSYVEGRDGGPRAFLTGEQAGSIPADGIAALLPWRVWFGADSVPSGDLCGGVSCSIYLSPCSLVLLHGLLPLGS